MFANHHYHPGLTQEAHRALPFISNTDLTETKNRALGITRQPNLQAMLFGGHFHTAVFEPARYERTTQRVPWAQIEDLAAAVRRQRFCRDLLPGPGRTDPHRHPQSHRPSREGALRPDDYQGTPLGQKPAAWYS